ncbi:MAG: hypothetical protein QOG12_1681, partial [Verrucomicrobiota bacterium]
AQRAEGPLSRSKMHRARYNTREDLVPILR